MRIPAGLGPVRAHQRADVRAQLGREFLVGERDHHDVARGVVVLVLADHEDDLAHARAEQRRPDDVQRGPVTGHAQHEEAALGAIPRRGGEEARGAAQESLHVCVADLRPPEWIASIEPQRDPEIDPRRLERALGRARERQRIDADDGSHRVYERLVVREQSTEGRERDVAVGVERLAELFRDAGLEIVAGEVDARAQHHAAAALKHPRDPRAVRLFGAREEQPTAAADPADCITEILVERWFAVAAMQRREHGVARTLGGLRNLGDMRSVLVRACVVRIAGLGRWRHVIASWRVLASTLGLSSRVSRRSTP